MKHPTLSKRVLEGGNAYAGKTLKGSYFSGCRENPYNFDDVITNNIQSKRRQDPFFVLISRKLVLPKTLTVSNFLNNDTLIGTHQCLWTKRKSYFIYVRTNIFIIIY